MVVIRYWLDGDAHQRTSGLAVSSCSWLALMHIKTLSVQSEFLCERLWTSGDWQCPSIWVYMACEMVTLDKLQQGQQCSAGNKIISLRTESCGTQRTLLDGTELEAAVRTCCTWPLRYDANLTVTFPPRSYDVRCNNVLSNAANRWRSVSKTSIQISGI